MLAGLWNPAAPAFALDDWDRWFRLGPCGDAADARAEEFADGLVFNGLATHADIWCNDEKVATSSSMFLPIVVDHAALATTSPLDGDWWIRFRSLRHILATTTSRRDRPRWRSRLVTDQALRRVRTSLFGRIPSWTPPAPVIGPWRSIDGQPSERVRVMSVRSTVRDTTDKGTGHATVEITLSVLASAASSITAVRIGTSDCAWTAAAGPDTGDGTQRISDPARVVVVASAELRDIALWWPHTHGSPSLHSLTVEEGDRITELASIGVRSVAVDRSDQGFRLLVNGVAVFARGACWVPIDPMQVHSSSGEHDPVLDDLFDDLVSAGMNMVRVGGTMFYENDAFHRRCDTKGVMVWQDFMFANLDVPTDDPAFVELVQTEVRHHTERLALHPSTTVLCGGSEVDQQASMMGVSAEAWFDGISRSVIEPVVAERATGLPFVDSTPSIPADVRGPRASGEPLDAPFPFHVDQGTGHYFGVGAYLRPIEDARRANVRFATECLAFANVPGERATQKLFGEATPITTHPTWKAGVPRDNGAGWDFEDVRDHYLKLLFGVDPLALRYADPDRYLQLSRMTSAEVLDATLSEWRHPASTCNGSLIWFLRDLVPGAGWGLLDASGERKPAYFGASRRWQPIGIALTDEGVNGLHAHVHNETASGCTALLDVLVTRDGSTTVDRVERTIDLPARSRQTVRVDGLLPGFRDLTWAYRFGAPVGDLVRVRLTAGQDARVVSDAHHWIAGRPVDTLSDGSLQITGTEAADGNERSLVVLTDRNAFGVHLDVEGYRVSDNWFHLAAGDSRTLRLTPRHGVDGTSEPRVTVRALNFRSSARVRWSGPEGKAE